MPTQFAIKKAAQAWCGKTTRNKVMDVELATEFAEILDREIDRMKNAGEYLWIVVANAGGGDWSKEGKLWKKTAGKARDNYHNLCAEMNRKTA